MASNVNKKRVSEVDELLSKQLKRFKDSWNYQKDNWHSSWERDNKLYNGERHTRSYEGLADTFVPMTFPMIETMVSALANGTLRFDFTSGDPLKDPDTRALNGLIDEWWEADQWDLKNEGSIREMLITGMAGGMLSWDIDHPKWDSYSQRDMIVDPTAVTPGDLQEPGSYAGRRYFVRKGSLNDFETVDVDPDSKTFGQLIKRYKLPKDSDATSKNPDEEPDRETKEMFQNSTLSTASDDQDEVIEIWDVDRVVTMMNRAHIIENVENPYKQRHQDLLTQRYTNELSESFIQQGIDDVTAQAESIEQATAQAKMEAKGLVPFFFFRNYRRLSLLYAKSEIDAIAPHQELLNDLTNLETDMLIKANGLQRELDPEYEDWLDLINEDPDTVYPFRPGSLAYIPRPQMGSNLFANRQNIKGEMREATAISQRSKGVESPTDPTATEVRSSDRGTDQRIESKARILEKDAFFWFATILFRQIQLYVTEPMVVKVTGPATKGKESGVYQGKELPPGTAVYDPADFDSDFIPTISLEVDSQTKKEESRKKSLGDFQILIQDPTNDIEAIKRVYYPKIFDLDKQDLDDILTPPEPEMGAGMMGDPAMAGQPPMPQGMPL